MQQQAQETVLRLLVPVLVHMPMPVAVAAAGLVVHAGVLGLQCEL